MISFLLIVTREEFYMARGFDEARERENKLSLFGKQLVRRSKSICELCETSGEKLNIYELGKKEPEPDYERCVHICDSCVNILENLERANENELRFLNNAIWSETTIVKATAIKIIRDLNGKYPWIDDLMEMIYIDDELETLLNKISK
jgi:protein PhnA